MGNKLLRIKLPLPHSKQRLILITKAKRVVIKAGRRGGKTTLAAYRSVRLASAGRKVLYATPVAEQADAYWEKLSLWLTVAIGIGLVKRNETKRILDFPGGGRIRCKTAHNADTLRGDYADFLILDEFAYMDPDAWTKVGAPMLLDNDGDAWFISTPIPRNHFWRMYLTAKADTTGRWEVFEFSSLDNPYLSKAGLAEITKDMTKSDFRQEILGEFVESEGSVFNNIAACMWHPDEEEINKHKSHPLAMTIDWGQIQDFTSISIGCKSCKRELKLIRWKGVSYPEQQTRIKGLRDHWHPETIIAEANAMGLPNIQALQEAGVEVSGFDTTQTSKRQLIQGLRLALEQATWMFVDDEAGKLELEAYEQKSSGSTGQVTFGAPEGSHDDSVISRALLVQAAESGFGW